MLEKNWDRGWFIHLSTVNVWGLFIHKHDLTLIIIDYAFGSAHVKSAFDPKSVFRRSSRLARRTWVLKHVKAWLIYPVQTTGEIKPFLIWNNAVFIPGGGKNLPQTKFGILKLIKVDYWWSRDLWRHRPAQVEFLNGPRILSYHEKLTIRNF